LLQKERKVFEKDSFLSVLLKFWNDSIVADTASITLFDD